MINPLTDSRWNDLVANHPRASAFHTRGWLEALARNYGYDPFAITSSPADRPLSDGIVVCRVASWITGKRLVSLPFSDHCEPLVNDPGDLFQFARWLRTECDSQRWRYVELRPLTIDPGGEGDLKESARYWFHELDLEPTVQQLFQRLHRECIRRKIRKAEQSHLSYQVGNSEQLVNDLYRLVLITRKRHRLLPQPRKWFQSLARAMGPNLQIRLVRKDDVATAGMITLRHRSTIIYKYGFSDAKFHHLGVMPFLFWHLIQESKSAGLEKIDFGRSDPDQDGLIIFKDRLGAEKRSISYFRYSRTSQKQRSTVLNSETIRELLSVLPGPLASTAGRFVYRHVG